MSKSAFNAYVQKQVHLESKEGHGQESLNHDRKGQKVLKGGGGPASAERPYKNIEITNLAVPTNMGAESKFKVNYINKIKKSDGNKSSVANMPKKHSRGGHADWNNNLRGTASRP